MLTGYLLKADESVNQKGRYLSSSLLSIPFCICKRYITLVGTKFLKQSSIVVPTALKRSSLL
jgi:hypothetical protein